MNAEFTSLHTDTSTLLGEYAELINRYGVSSSEVKIFLSKHSENREFVELAEMANFLRAKLNRYQADPQPPAKRK
jgi:hypothetical protein